MENNVVLNQNPAEIDRIRGEFFSRKCWEHDNLVLDACTMMWRRYINAEGRVCGYDVEPFFERVYVTAPEIQKAKYPNGEEKFIIIPESCVIEIVRKARNISGEENPETVQSGILALERFQKLMALGVLAVIEDNTLGSLGDGALSAMAMQANSRKRLLYVMMDQPLGRDLLALRNMASVRMSHSVYSIDPHGWFAPIRAQSFPYVRKATPISGPRGFGSISRYSFEGQPPETPDEVLNAEGEMEEDELLFDIDGQPIRLAAEIGQGSESQIFKVAGSDDLIVKVFGRPTAWKQAKVELLSSRNFVLPAAIMPEKPVYTQDGVFKGYVMKYAADTIPLSYLFNGASRKKYIEGWDRRHFSKLGRSLAQAYCWLHIKGILLSDISDTNARVYLDDNGHADPERVCIIDIDSAQLGPVGGPVYGPDGLTPSYAAPETLREGWERGQLRSYSSELFGVNVIVARALMCGLHPYRAVNADDDDPEYDEVDAIRDGKFPYGSATVRKASGVDSPGLGAYLWSFLSKSLKSKLHESLTLEDKRLPLLDKGDNKGLISIIDEYIDWLNRDSTAQAFPQALSLAPTQFKPYATRCAHCGTPFDAANTTGWWSRKTDGEEEFICPTCATKPNPASVCAVCRKPTQTLGEAFVGKRKRSLCPECFEKGSKLMAYIGHCVDCGRSFPVTHEEAASRPTQCPSCRIKAAKAG